MKRSKELRVLTEDMEEHYRRVNELTNWQRHQWARGGYRKDAVGHFTRLQKVTVDAEVRGE